MSGATLVTSRTATPPLATAVKEAEMHADIRIAGRSVGGPAIASTSSTSTTSGTSSTTSPGAACRPRTLPRAMPPVVGAAGTRWMRAARGPHRLPLLRLRRILHPAVLLLQEQQQQMTRMTREAQSEQRQGRHPGCFLRRKQR